MTGLLNVYKAEGASSAAAVNRIKKLAGVPCGHMGTLDPLACGVLPVGVGNATRLFDYFLEKTKRYRARFRFGVTTETLDREGALFGEGSVPSAQALQAAANAFVGEIDQIPPRYSAKSVNGRRGYELARAGEQFTLSPKCVSIRSFCLTGQTAPDEFEFEIVCGGGTYIRSLARDLAAACGTLGYMSFLERSQSGPFTAETAVPLEELTKENLADHVIPTESVLPFPRLIDFDYHIFHGIASKTKTADGLYKIYKGEEFYGIACVSGGYAKIKTKLC